jgi:uncharacterized protein YwqG
MSETREQILPLLRERFGANRHRWRCLLQLGSDYDLYGGWWGDGGTIAFMIREEDLRGARFEACWCVVSSS